MKDLAIVILNYNGTEDTIECLQSIDRSITDYQYDIYVLDNGSRNDEVEKINEYFEMRKDFNIILFENFIKSDYRGNCFIISRKNWGFASGNNHIVKVIFDSYKFMLLLNNDTIVTSDFINRMLGVIQDESIGYASCRINNYYNRDLLWNCGGTLKIWGLRKYYNDNQLKRKTEIFNAEFITGCALFINSHIIEKYGLFTEQFFHGEEDFNFCYRMKIKHVRGVCLNETLVYHKVSATSSETGITAGKIAAYYVYRFADMKSFYPKAVWIIWRKFIILLLNIKWIVKKIDKNERKKINVILRKTKDLSEISKEDTFRIWNLDY